MEKNKRGFISMTLVYTFLIIFLFLMLAILSTYNTKNKYLEAIDSKVDDDIRDNRNSRDGILNKLITDNTPDVADTLKFHKLANLNVGNGNGLYYSTDAEIFDEDADNSIANKVYFFRGEVENNYLILGSSCFRILRSDEYGNIRMIYGGEASGGRCVRFSNGQKVATMAYNDANASNGYQASPKSELYLKYIYTFGATRTITSPSSTIRTYLENWFNNKFSDNAYLVDSIYCNNMSTGGPAVGGVSYYNAYGFNTEIANLEDQNEFVDNLKFKKDFAIGCESKEDRYSISSFIKPANPRGNQLLTASVGLITAEEAILAGGEIDLDNTSYFLHRGNSYWTMSPYSYDNVNGAQVAYIDGNGAIKYAPVNTQLDVVPVVTISKNSSVAGGTGKYDDPYRLK